MKKYIPLKITSRLVKSIFSEQKVKKTVSLTEDFVVVLIDKAANNVAFVCNISTP